MLSTKTIGNKIAQARKTISISQAQLAQRLFISPQAVGKWERGESMPDITTFSRMAEVLGVDLNYFLDNSKSEITSAELPSGKPKNKLSWDMSCGNWIDGDFSGLKNLHEKLDSSNMQRCKFIGSDLSELLAKGNNLDSCDFSGSDISNSKIQTSSLDNNLFKDCSLKGTDFLRSHIKDCDFSGSDLSVSQIQGSHLGNSLFKSCTLKEAKFSKSHINRCDFSGANFTGTAFKSSAFQENTVANAVWNHTLFIGTEIADVVFEGAFVDCYFEKCVFNWVKFQNLTLMNTFFKNNRFKRIQFVDTKVDRITYEFLKNEKVDLTGVTLREEEK